MYFTFGVTLFFLSFQNLNVILVFLKVLNFLSFINLLFSNFPIIFFYSVHSSFIIYVSIDPLSYFLSHIPYLSSVSSFLIFRIPLLSLIIHTAKNHLRRIQSFATVSTNQRKFQHPPLYKSKFNAYCIRFLDSRWYSFPSTSFHPLKDSISSPRYLGSHVLVCLPGTEIVIMILSNHLLHFQWKIYSNINNKKMYQVYSRSHQKIREAYRVWSYY